MKFAHDFTEALEKGEYPAQWIESAISYRRLKKCIKKVQRELLTLGLEPDTLNTLWQSLDAGKEKEFRISQRPGFSYEFTGDTTDFRPKLTFVLDPQDGSPVDARLSADTKAFLQEVARCKEEEELDTVDSKLGRDFANIPIRARPLESNIATGHRHPADNGVQEIEVPLASDAEFFQILKKELSSLEELQEVEQKRLTQQIARTGQDVAGLANHSTDRSKVELYAWRRIFRLYLDSEIFFSTSEQDTGARDSASAQKNLQKFTVALGQLQKEAKLRRKGLQTLDNFMQINFELLRNIKFQDINRMALTKILKKFDKRTALHAQLVWPQFMAEAPFLASDMAKAVCYTVSQDLLAVIPQLDDYLCPICFSVSFKPIRLRCQHVFCIRCLVVMQRDNQKRCPMCRDESVMTASSQNLDQKLLTFLNEKFPKEVKLKQKENERAAGVDQYGEEYQKCMVM